MSLERQLELEEQMLSEGSEKYLKSIDAMGGDEFESVHVQKLAKTLILPFADIIQADTDEKVNTYKSGARHILHNISRLEVTAGQLSYLVIRHAMCGIRLGTQRVVALSIQLGKAVNLNIEDDTSKMDKKTCATIGIYLIERLAECYPEYFDIKTDYFDMDSKHKERLIGATDKMNTFMESVIESIADMAAVVYPMVHKPADWTSEGLDGGFYNPKLKRNIVKKRKGGKSGINAKIAKTVNSVQSTPWVVNNDVLPIMLDLDKIKPHTLGKVYPKEVEKTPERPFDKSLLMPDMTDEQKHEHCLWARQAMKMSKDRTANASVEMTVNSALAQAEMFKSEPVIHFPHDIDYRDRLYNMCMTGLNTQGADIQKGLIKFGRSRAVTTTNGIMWLQINMANLVGHDKLPLLERQAWTVSNEALLREVVKNPQKCTYWHAWDKPVQGLAAAIEYVKWLDNDQALLNIHVQLDGLCNGVQHLAAITRDDIVAPHVGLVKTVKRGDVYGYVCEQTMVHENFHGSFANEWLSSDLMDRSLPKTPVMTRSYGSTLYGIKDGIQDYIDSKGKTRHFEDAFKAGNWMGERIWESMDDAIKGPMAFMKWVQAVAGVFGHKDVNRAMYWTNIAGMRCVQSPFKTKRQQIKVTTKNGTVNYRMQTPTTQINKSKMESSSSPNVIHSCDASHMVHTSDRCIDDGIVDFGMVHDSFGAAPDDAAPLLQHAKEAWASDYSHNWMQIWYDDWTEQLSDIGAEVPHWSEYVKMGTLCSKSVLESEYFFA